MEVVICGPNLNDQSKGQFHAHAAGCHDLVRHSRREPEYKNGWSVEAQSVRDVVEAIFSDFIYHNDKDPWTEFTGEIHFFPCCQLPMESELDFTAIGNIGEADAQVLADEEYTEGIMVKTVEHALTELGKDVSELSSQELDDAIVAYLNGAMRGFKKSMEELKGQFKTKK